jgi:hypothetical protein
MAALRLRWSFEMESSNKCNPRTFWKWILYLLEAQE